MASVTFTNRAIDDMDTIGEYHAHYSPNYASQLQDAIIARVKALKEFPEMGRLVPEFNRAYLRELIYKLYRIVYRLVSDTQIDILPIRHSSRDLAERFFDI